MSIIPIILTVPIWLFWTACFAGLMITAHKLPRTRTHAETEDRMSALIAYLFCWAISTGALWAIYDSMTT